MLCSKNRMKQRKQSSLTNFIKMCELRNNNKENRTKLKVLIRKTNKKGRQKLKKKANAKSIILYC